MLKKVITLAIAVMTLVSLVSCRAERSVTKTTTSLDPTSVSVTERYTKNGKLINEIKYDITFDTVEEAEKYVSIKGK